MAFSTLSYAQSLRVIGQALESLRINAFKLENHSDQYIVRDWEPSYLKSVVGEDWGKSDFGQEPSRAQKSGNLLIYTDSDTARLEARARSRRSAAGNPESYKIASGLRSVGGYLDDNKAVNFEIVWSNKSVRVTFEAATGNLKTINFTAIELQDLALRMHLRRSNR